MTTAHAITEAQIKAAIFRGLGKIAPEAALEKLARYVR